MKKYTLTEIQAVVGGTLVGEGLAGISHVITDSRTEIVSANSLFVALAGTNRNGHDFIKDLYEKGVRNFLVSEQVVLPDANILQVDNTLQALQKLAAHHRMQFAARTIGITGSNGKTVVKEWLYQLLRHDYNIIRSPKSYNSQLGVPLSVLHLNREHDLAIFEAGISKPGEMERLEQMIRPELGILTNIGPAHSEGFRDELEKATEKLQLFKNAKALVYCTDHAVVVQALANSGLKAEQIGWSKNELPANLPFSDDASRENMGHCMALLRYLGYDDAAIQLRLDELTPIAMRLELTQGLNHTLILNDSYNSDIASLEIALDTMHQHRNGKPLTLILSDILQDRTPDEQLYGKVAEIVERAGVTNLIGIGRNISGQKARFKKARFFESTEAFLQNLNPVDYANQAMVLKGARSFNFEKIALVLQHKAHETTLEVNLNALQQNLNDLRQKLNPNTRVMAMVKAFSYGAGSAEVPQLLERNGVDYLGVAYADEGVLLRQAGIELPILVMNPDASGFHTLITHNLEPEIYALKQLDDFIRAVIDHGRQGYPIHIKLETGMNRLGISANDVTSLIANIKAQPEVRIASVFSHLAASDSPNHDDFSLRQIAEFTSLSERILGEFDYPILRHILNTAGATRFPQAEFDMVRLGIGLYGADPTHQQDLAVVSTLRTRVTQIKNVAKGESVGYDRSAVMDRDSQIAILPIGYADGLSRRLSNGVGKVWIKNKMVPVVGKVCMDMCMVDVTDMQVKPGDEVEIFGTNIAIEQLAEWMDTIPYEVLTGISQRVKRVYISA